MNDIELKWIKEIPHTAYREVPNDFIRLDLAVNKHPLSQKVIQSLKSNLNKVNEYPDTNWSILVKKIADYNKVSEKQILISNGLEEAIDIITRAFVRKGEKVLILTPTYSQFYIAVLRQEAKVVTVEYVENEDFSIPVEKIKEIAKNEDIKLTWLCNPNNPTGTVFERQQLVSLIEALDCTVVVDECFYEFCGETSIDLLDRFGNLIVIRSFSKSFGLAGIRFGYIVTNEEIIDSLLRLRQPSSVNILAQFAALASLEDLDYYKTTWDEIRKERENLKKELQNLGTKVFSSGTNFLYVKINDAETVFKKLWNSKIFVFPSWDPEFIGGKKGYLRILVGLPNENKQLVDTLKKIL